MRISYKGDYGLKAMLALAINYGKKPLNIHQLAGDNMPIKFLEQVLLELKRAGFVSSMRGKSGGYFLTKNPSKIKLGDVVRFIDGIKPIACIEKNYSGCNDINNCVFRDIWINIDKSISKILDSITFEDLANKASKKTFVYQI